MAAEINRPVRGTAGRTFCEVSAKAVTDYMLESRSMLRKFYAEEYASGCAGRFQRWPLSVAALPRCRDAAIPQDRRAEKKKGGLCTKR